MSIPTKEEVQMDRPPGSAYYVPATDRGVAFAGFERDTLDEAVKVVESLTEEDRQGLHSIERREVRTTGEYIAGRFTLDGARPFNFNLAADVAYKLAPALTSPTQGGQPFSNSLGVSNSTPVIESHLTYGESALRDAKMLVRLIETGLVTGYVEAHARAEKPEEKARLRHKLADLGTYIVEPEVTA